MATAMVPSTYDPHLAKSNIEVETETVYAMAKRLAREQGLLAGISAAAAVVASVRVVQEEAAAGAARDHCDRVVRLRRQVSQRAILGGILSLLRMTRSVYDSIRAHGEETYPHECCGALLGQSTLEGWRITTAVRAGNTRTDSAHNRYSIAPLELVQIEREARPQGLEIAGFYHSHPDHPARWSATDFAEAHWLHCSYVITEIAQGKAAVTNSFLLTGHNEEEKQFVQQSIQIED